MTLPSQNLERLGLTLPQAPAPVASYIPAQRQGSLVFVSGQLPMRDGSLMATGHVGADVDIETAQHCAQQCVLNGLAAACSVIDSIDDIERVVRVGCFVACGPDFNDQPKVANGASDLLREIFGDNGQHARAAVGSVSLPLGTPVEVEFLFAVR
ncbi:MAG: RidA family protein [Phycisphaerales bacterium JB043]